MTNDIGLVPIDQPTKNGEVEQERQQVKDNLWRIDKAIDDGQFKALPDDGKREEGAIIIPENRNSV